MQTIVWLLLVAAADSSAPAPIRSIRHPTYCVDMQDTNVGSPIVLEHCNESPGQAWAFSQGRLMCQGRCLNVQNNVDNGNPVFVGDCANGSVAQWIEDNAKLHVANTEQCLDVSLGTVINRVLRVWRCGLAPHSQAWLVEAPADDDALQGSLRFATNAASCVTVQGGSTLNGTPIQLNHCNGAADQVWIYEDGALIAFDKCMTAASASPGAPVVLTDCFPAAAQSWNSVGDTFQMANTGLCLDGNSPTSPYNTQLFLQPCNGGAGQSWRLE